MHSCPSCRGEVPADARFCPACGEEQIGPRAGREERKVVSVLFVDLVGFTSSSDRADPEDVRDRLEAYYALVRSRIEDFGGEVEKFIGDAVMAVFGAPLAHSDDAERAVRAALRVQQAIAELKADDPDHALSTRAAVNTGEAVVTMHSQHEVGRALALGDVVNTASRLQTAAPIGGVIVGEETYRATRRSILYEQVAPVEAKGKAQALKAWLAVEPVTEPAARPSGSAPTVGRDRELDMLGAIWERATTEQRPHLVTVIAPAGMGKSRLGQEASRRIAPTGRSILGQSLPYEARGTYGAFAQIVRHVAGIADADPSTIARQKLADTVDRLLPEPERREQTRSLSLLLALELDDPVEERILLFFAARRFVEALGMEQPTLIVFEDIHWADPGQLDLIEYLATHVRSTAVVLLSLARPELFEVRPTWGSGLGAQSTLTLEPLSDADAAVIAAHALGGEPASTVERLVAIAEGNPLFIEELSAAVGEGIDPGAQLPTTVRAAIAARIDALPQRERDTLLAASAVGKTFWHGAVAALLTNGEPGEQLAALEARDLIRRVPASKLPGDVEYAFRHALIHEVAYTTLPRAERRQAHAAVARRIEEAVDGRAGDLARALAHHWREAGEPGRSVPYLLQAADQALAAWAEKEAIGLYDEALALAPDTETATRVRLRRALARVALDESSEIAVEELRPLVDELRGAERLEALMALSKATHWSERTAETIQLAERALRLARDEGPREFVGPAMGRLSQGLAMRGEEGDLDRAQNLGEQALAEWLPGTQQSELAEHRHLLADQHYWVGSYQRALDLSVAVRGMAVEPGSAEALLRGGGMEGLVLAAMGRYEEALTRFDAQIDLARELGRPYRVLLNYSTMAYRDLLELDEARQRSEQAIEQLGRSGSFHMPWMNAESDLIQTDLLALELGAAEGRWNNLFDEVVATSAWERWLLGTRLAAIRAEIALRMERVDDALEWAARTIDWCRPVRRVKYEVAARRTLAVALVRKGDASRGVAEARAAVAGADRLGNPPSRWQTRVTLGGVLLATGDDDGAATAYAEAASVIRTVAGSLSPERAMRFLSAPTIVEALAAAG